MSVGMTYEARLIIKDEFELDGKPRVNTLKISLLNDGTCLLWISNGNNRYGRFVLKQDAAKQLLTFLQEHA